MSNSLAISVFLLAFFASITFNGFFRNIAKNNKILIDIPDKSRKFHFRATPLTGGIGIFFSILITGLLLTGITDARYSTNFSDGFLENTILNDGTISKNFEVDKSFKLKFIRKNTSYSKFFRSKNSYKDLLDLRGLLNYQLKKEGIKKIYNIRKDTYKNSKIFFSHRRSTHQNKKESGRMINIIALRD